MSATPSLTASLGVPSVALAARERSHTGPAVPTKPVISFDIAEFDAARQRAKTAPAKAPDLTTAMSAKQGLAVGSAVQVTPKNKFAELIENKIFKSLVSLACAQVSSSLLSLEDLHKSNDTLIKGSRVGEGAVNFLAHKIKDRLKQDSKFDQSSDTKVETLVAAITNVLLKRSDINIVEICKELDSKT